MQYASFSGCGIVLAMSNNDTSTTPSPAREFIGAPDETEPEPAFPVPLQFADKGMTLRDYFAAKAMAATLNGDSGEDIPFEMIASISYKVADAMLEARK
jgi:hypothetical protein